MLFSCPVPEVTVYPTGVDKLISDVTKPPQQALKFRRGSKFILIKFR